jgi:hypothetical protein
VNAFHQGIGGEQQNRLSLAPGQRIVANPGDEAGVPCAGAELTR